MTITEKVAYIKGLCAGLELDAEKKETKVLNAIIDLLDDIALCVTDVEDDIISMGDEIDCISDDLTNLEDDVYDEEDEDEEDECDCDDCKDEDDDFFEVECPNCSEKLYVDDGVLDDGSIVCPGCGKEVIFQIADDCDCCDHEEHCDCDCDK